MNPLIDLHVHTISSGHAYSTITEIVEQARRIDLPMVGISDHGPGMPAGAHPFHFYNMRILPKTIQGVRVFRGIEVNIMDEHGTLDVEERLLNMVDYAIASLHTPCIEPKTKLINTKAMVLAMKNPNINILGHPDDDRYPYDEVEVAKAAKQYQVLVEVNNSSMNGYSVRSNSFETIVKLLIECKKIQTPIIFGSDAHYHSELANFTYCWKAVEAVDFPRDLIANFNEPLLKKCFSKAFVE